VSALVLCSVWLRTRSLNLHYWVDEGLSVGIASHPLSQIPALMRQDGSPPLYYLLLHLWMSVFGRGEVATHELSLLFALLAIPVAYWGGATLFNRRTGLVCAVLAAGVPYLGVYAQETRMYSLLALFALLVAISFVHVFVLRHRRYLPVFIVSLTGALYTHNWAVFLAMMSVVAFLLCARAYPQERRALWRDGAVAFGGVALLFAPWLPTVLYQARHTGAPWDLPPVFWNLTQGAYSLVGGRGAAVALLFGGGAGLVALRETARDQRWLRLTAEALLVLGVGTLLTAWVYSKISPAWAPRYLAVIVGPLLVLFGLGVARSGRLGMVALALVICFWVLDPVPTKLDSKSNVASAIAKVRPHLGSDPLVLSTQPEEVPTLAYYLHGAARYATPLGFVPDPRVVDWRSALERFRHSSLRRTPLPLLTSLAPGQRVALVLPMNLPKTPQWMTLINHTSDRWASVLSHDHALKLVAHAAVHWTSSGVPVLVEVFAQRGGSGASAPAR
jgi:hypothetical protein